MVEKLGLRREGYYERFLDIDGGWRDHVAFAITVEELQGPVDAVRGLSPAGDPRRNSVSLKFSLTLCDDTPCHVPGSNRATRLT